MSRDRRLTVALHVLLHMSEIQRSVTSESLGPLMKQNPAALRRTMGGVRQAGIVRSEKGHGGGWSLARKLDTVTLGEVYDALGLTAPFRIAQADGTAKCLLERAANRAVGRALAEAEKLLVDRLRTITVAEVLADARHEGVRKRYERKRRASSR
jgi:DNA-binding IscR family transcriptional regulator